MSPNANDLPTPSSPVEEQESARRIGIAPKLSGLLMAGLSVAATIKANVDPVDTSSHRSDALVSVDVGAGMQPIAGDFELPGLDLSVSGSLPGRSNNVIAKLETSKNTVTPGEAPEATEPQTTTQVITKTTPGYDIHIPAVAEIARTLVTSEKQEQIPDIYMEWARLFSADPNSDKLVQPPALDEAVADILALQGDNSKILEIICTGYASDEDDHSDTHPETTNPGFGIPSQKNVDLATKRGAVVTTGLAERLQGTLANVPIINAQGVELQDDQLQNEIFGIAASEGINPVQLVKEFNRGDYSHLTPKEQEVLSGLESNRFVRCVVKVEETEVVEDVHITPAHTIEVPAKTTTKVVVTEKPGEIDYGTEDQSKSEDSTSEGTYIKGNVRTRMSFKVVFIPMVVPFLRRKKAEGDLEIEDPVIITPTVKLPPPVVIGDPPPPIGDPPPPPPPPQYGPRRHNKRPPIERVRVPKIYHEVPNRIQQYREHSRSQTPHHKGGRTGRDKGGNINRRSR